MMKRKIRRIGAGRKPEDLYRRLRFEESEIIKGTLKELKRTQTELAHYLKISPVSLSFKLNGRYGLKSPEARRIFTYLHNNPKVSFLQNFETDDYEGDCLFYARKLYSLVKDQPLGIKNSLLSDLEKLLEKYEK